MAIFLQTKICGELFFNETYINLYLELAADIENNQHSSAYINLIWVNLMWFDLFLVEIIVKK
jgi:hypothetical protein